MLIGKKTKSPTDRKRYVVDYVDWVDDGETLASATYEVSDVTASVDGDSVDGTQAVFFINGGTDGTTFNVVIEVTTSVGQVKSDHIEFVVKEG